MTSDDKELYDLLLIDEKGSWEKWFAWKPVYIHDKKYWLKTIYRRRLEIKWPRAMSDAPLVGNFSRDYGTIFDVIKNDSK